jgi:hypothetical protein
MASAEDLGNTTSPEFAELFLTIAKTRMSKGQFKKYEESVKGTIVYSLKD